MAAPGFNYIRACRKVIGVGRNYAAHAAELGNAVSESPLLFLKPSSSFLQPGAGPIVVPRGCSELHHEVELGVVIGKTGRHIPAAEADKYISGYCLVLDMTSRELQEAAKARGYPWSVAKGYDTFLPAGPFIEKAALGPKGPQNVELWCKVDGELRQKGNTADMLWKIPELVSYISSIFTLEEGDVIITGTPSGVGPVRPGNTVSVGITGMEGSTLSFPVAAAADQQLQSRL